LDDISGLTIFIIDVAKIIIFDKRKVWYNFLDKMLHSIDVLF